MRCPADRASAARLRVVAIIAEAHTAKIFPRVTAVMGRQEHRRLGAAALLLARRQIDGREEGAEHAHEHQQHRQEEGQDDVRLVRLLGDRLARDVDRVQRARIDGALLGRLAAKHLRPSLQGGLDPVTGGPRLRSRAVEEHPDRLRTAGRPGERDDASNSSSADLRAAPSASRGRSSDSTSTRPPLAPSSGAAEMDLRRLRRELRGRDESDGHVPRAVLPLNDEQALDHDPAQGGIHADRQDEGVDQGLAITEALDELLARDPQSSAEDRRDSWTASAHGAAGPSCQTPKWSAPSSVTKQMSSIRRPNFPGW